MQKILAILNKYSILINSICIVFWLYIIYENYKASQEGNSFDERKSYFIIPTLFILLSVFNMYMVEKRKRRN
ncbi:hypothetical protein [Flavobacterium dankookense]|uniref:Uncharacterized protein n=1 Tax=Flavobacterium dankookense TaxID=706186 RepID=A0A4R6Q8D8_9FLAO|nr:hypothetical protein [Flavobacterium dankookense]TDP57419.1 hypothetical protein BC748_2939 [Flavobacterium dankookense]